MPQLRLTDLSIKALKGTGRQVTYWCDRTPNFCVRVSQKGTKTFVVMVGRERKRLTLGRYPTLNLKEARAEARRHLAETVPSFISPTLEVAYQAFIDVHVRPNYSPQWAKETDRILTKYLLHLHDVPVADISTLDLTDIIDGLAGLPSQANHTYAVFRTFFNWCVRRRYVDSSPLQGLSKPHRETSRDRYLTDDEIVEIWNATHSLSPYNLIVRILLVTGQRTKQIAHLREEWVDERNRVINFPPEIMKNKEPHTLPFGRLTHYLLQSALPVDGYYFSYPKKPGTPFITWSKPKRRLDEKLRLVAPFTLHDFRRTWATIAARLEIQPHVIERVLAHTQGVQSPIAKIYNRYPYQREMREAMEKVESHILNLVSPEDMVHDHHV